MNHLFIDCLFSKKIWDRLNGLFKIKRKWEGKDLADCFYKWTKDKTVTPSLATITIWYIWIERNRTIFENLQSSIHSIFIKVLGLFKQHSSSIPVVPLRDCNLNYLEGFSIAFFDGDS